jgi:hypothetical protein
LQKNYKIYKKYIKFITKWTYESSFQKIYKIYEKFITKWTYESCFQKNYKTRTHIFSLVRMNIKWQSLGWRLYLHTAIITFSNISYGVQQVENTNKRYVFVRFIFCSTQKQKKHTPDYRARQIRCASNRTPIVDGQIGTGQSCVGQTGSSSRTK